MQEQRELCTNPACLHKREGKGKYGSRFLFSWWFENGRIVIEVPCPDCGRVYRVPISIPEKVLAESQ